MKIELNIDLDRLQWLGGLGLVLACASCVPSPRTAGSNALPAMVAAAALPTPEDFDPAEKEEFSRKVAELLVPISNDPAAPFSDNSHSQADRERSLSCLTAAVYYEARSESEDGQRAVAQVVLNRVRHPAYPSTVCGVVFQGQERATGCQFSFTCDGSMRGRREPGAWSRARQIAEEAMAGYVFAPVGNATHYHTTAIRPYWASHLQKSTIVGSHIFYRWAGSAGEASAFRQRHGGLEPAPSLWRSAREETSNGVTVHRGFDADEPMDDSQTEPEQVVFDQGSSVRIHRGTTNEPDHQPEIQQQPTREARNVSGVRVHVGTSPTTG